MTSSAQNFSCCGESSIVLDPKSQAIKDFYDSVALDQGPYDSSIDKFSPSGPTEKIREIARSSAPASLIDIGCGMGTTLISLAKELSAKLYVGVDFSEPMIERAKKERDKALSEDVKKTVGFFTADASHLPYMDDQFEFAYSECVLTLLPDRAKGFNEIGRVLATNGIFVYTDFVTTQDVPESIRNDLALVSGCRAGAWTLEKNIQLLQNAGFSSVETFDYTESKNARYDELKKNSEEIANEFEHFKQTCPESLSFLEDKVNYFVFVARKG